MLNQGWQNALTASLLAFVIFVVIPRACGGDVDEEAAEAAECFVIWDGREYAIDCAIEEVAEDQGDGTDTAIDPAADL